MIPFMKRISLARIAAAAAATILLCPALCSCEGRTAKNMTPSGETVEVVIAPVSDPDSAEQISNDIADSLRNSL